MKSNLRNEIKSYIVRSGYTMQEVVDRLSEDYGRSVIIGLGKIQSYQWFASSKQEVFI